MPAVGHHMRELQLPEKALLVIDNASGHLTVRRGVRECLDMCSCFFPSYPLPVRIPVRHSQWLLGVHHRRVGRDSNQWFGVIPALMGMCGLYVKGSRDLLSSLQLKTVRDDV